MKKVLACIGNLSTHWVGDGFPVRTLFSYDNSEFCFSPFLLLDFVGPYHFEPSNRRRGVGSHPHRGFETVTIVYEGEISHRDSEGNSGTIGPGDVQWMTAASGILHEEFHSIDFSRSGGALLGVQLWVNLPAANKMFDPSYQSLVSECIPIVNLPNDGGRARIIAGDFHGTPGPARTFTPINLWDIRLNASRVMDIPVPEGHTSILVGISGHIVVDETVQLAEGAAVLLSCEGVSISVRALGPSILLVLTGLQIDEPTVGYGPFVMNTEDQIYKAVDDFKTGRFGEMSI